MPMSPRLLRPIASGIDPDVLAFRTASGATNLSEVNAVVRYLRNQGLLSAARFYPMKSSQNAGTGSTVYGIGGLTAQNITLVNSPTWGATGITFSNASGHEGSVTSFPTQDVSAGTLLIARFSKSSASTSDTFNATTNPQTVMALGGPASNNNVADSYVLRIVGGKPNLAYRNAANTGFLDVLGNAHVIGTADTIMSSLSSASSNRLFVNGAEVGGYTSQQTGAGRAASSELLIARNANTSNTRRFDGVITALLIVHAVATQSQLETLNTLMNSL